MQWSSFRSERFTFNKLRLCHTILGMRDNEWLNLLRLVFGLSLTEIEEVKSRSLSFGCQELARYIDSQSSNEAETFHTRNIIEKMILEDVELSLIFNVLLAVENPELRSLVLQYKSDLPNSMAKMLEDDNILLSTCARLRMPSVDHQYLRHVCSERFEYVMSALLNPTIDAESLVWIRENFTNLAAAENWEEKVESDFKWTLIEADFRFSLIEERIWIHPSMPIDDLIDELESTHSFEIVAAIIKNPSTPYDLIESVSQMMEFWDELQSTTSFSREQVEDLSRRAEQILRTRT